MANDNNTEGPNDLTEQQRREAFRQALAAGNEPSTVRSSRNTIPTKFIAWMLVAFVVLGGGGVIVEHYFGNIGVPITTTTVFKLQPTPSAPSGSQIATSFHAMMNLKAIGNATAPDFSLHQPSGALWKLSSQRGKVVVLTFADSNCNDICPVLASELQQAEQLLGTKAAHVEFAVVNANPNLFQVNPTPLFLSQSGLASLSNVHFLTGQLPTLNAVWINYGVTIRVGAQSTQVAHNNIMYFVGPDGQLRYSAVPFANESTSGVFSLPAPTVTQFAEGIAQTASSLVK